MGKDQKTIQDKEKNPRENKSNKVEKKYYFLNVPKVDRSVLNYLKETDSFFEANFSNCYDFEMMHYPLDYDFINWTINKALKNCFYPRFPIVLII